MQILVKTPTGKTLTLNVEGSETIRSLKSKIQQHEGVVLNPLYERLSGLLFGGKRLKDGRTLEDCDIHNDATLELLVVPPVGRGRRFVDIHSLFLMLDNLGGIAAATAMASKLNQRQNNNHASARPLSYPRRREFRI